MTADEPRVNVQPPSGGARRRAASSSSRTRRGVSLLQHSQPETKGHVEPQGAAALGVLKVYEWFLGYIRDFAFLNVPSLLF
jgi:hypothetical protein